MTHRTTEEEMEGPISFWGYKEQESNLILPEHDDDYEIKLCLLRDLAKMKAPTSKHQTTKT